MIKRSSLILRCVGSTFNSLEILRFNSSVTHGADFKKAEGLRKRGPLRTRFAPSPTGHVHLGSLRTALFNFLIAKATDGQFILRIEDTDQKRTVPHAIQRIYEDLRWTGIHWDEGPDIGGPFGPYEQSERLPIYVEYANKLVETEYAYRCFCSPSRLEALALTQAQQRLPNGYDRYCTHLSKEDSDSRAKNGDSYVIRLKAPDIYPPFSDSVYGFVKQTRKHHSIDSFDDPIILKSDGFPTYHLANVVDDHLMKITDVIRGAEWMSSTHKHIALYKAFGWQPPNFSHVGLLLDESRRKLSKRKASMEISHLRSQGIFPDSLTNFVALLGWSHGRKNDVMNLKELIENASMKYTRGDTVVCFDKLYFLQRRHAARYASLISSDQFPIPLYHYAITPIIRELENRSKFEDFSTYTKLPPGEPRQNYVLNLFKADAANYTLPREFIERNIYFFVHPSLKTLAETISTDIKHLKSSADASNRNIDTLLILFRTVNEIDLDEWENETLRARVNWIIEQRTKLSSKDEAVKLGVFSDSISRDKIIKKSWSKFVHQYLRWALCANKPGPDGITILFLLGKENVSERLRRAEEVVRLTTERIPEITSPGLSEISSDHKIGI